MTHHTFTRLLTVGAVVALTLTAATSLARAEGTTGPIAEIDLPRMTLPLGAYNPEYADFVFGGGGFTPEGEVGAEIAVNSYLTGFEAPEDASDFGAIGAFSEVSLFTTGTDTAALVAALEADLLTQAAEMEGELELFDVPGVDDAIGFRIASSFPEFEFVSQFTGAFFPAGRLIGYVAFLRFDNAGVEGDVIAAAAALRDRMKGVIAGDITDFPAPLPPDVNCNGIVDPIDASLILQLDAGLVSTLRCDELADANRDGRTNAIDASLVLQFSAGIVETLPV
jgi:hypothetical protein